jgi:PiT family inorganic phosphate transporter
MEQAIIIIALLFALINGFHDGCNVIATIVTSRSMSPRRALVLACIAEFIGAIALGTAVALTIGKGILSSQVFALPMITIQKILLSTVIGAILWNLITWFIGLPSSSSHALVGGMVGSGVVSIGLSGVMWKSFFFKVILPLLMAPLLGFIGGIIIMRLSLAIFRNRKPSITIVFKKVQALTMIFLAGSHGSNDSQKAMGIIALSLTAYGSGSFSVPPWVMLSCAAAISVGLSFGGWRIIKTIGKQVSKMTPLHSFDSQISSGIIIYFSSIFGFPVSTTQIVGSSVMGVGTGYKAKSVRWSITKDILTAWLITIPATGLMAAATFMLLITYVG